MGFGLPRASIRPNIVLLGEHQYTACTTVQSTHRIQGQAEQATHKKKTTLLLLCENYDVGMHRACVMITDLDYTTRNGRHYSMEARFG